MRQMAIRILLADDHTMVREGLRMILESQPDITMVGEADNGREAVRLTDQLRPDVVIMDVAMPELNGIEATRSILAQGSTTRVIILSMHLSSSIPRGRCAPVHSGICSKPRPVWNLSPPCMLCGRDSAICVSSSRIA